MLLYYVAASAGRAQATPPRPQTEPPRAIPERCQGGSIADHLLNQRLFWTAMAFGALVSKTDSWKLEKWRGADMEAPVNSSTSA